ncbi:TIGR04283 family arsenosugar biosynthesis glycosyltransferase [Alienimonas californiensis]|uniref:PGL/p-HBAD biosynthesis glycosyltransferase n=1 Tax=Alienimonas californiensis TaxID=2527989 RepID=A0A517PEZ0_9PLAN|nr:TIGR04283 family arsenosugar biosynthesis glycosyltransferase [Alienimonas californiensis]QDT17951.1 PGL/p-HBAD biosynthesis glycosyltransferase [Alienimonas californiensis]
MSDGHVSVVIPTLNEAAALPETLAHLGALDPPPGEVIVADGGSGDGTVSIAEAAGARVVRSPAGRARQMNAGAAAATGELLCFLHADTVLPPDYLATIAAALAEPGTALVGGRTTLTGPHGPSRLTSLHHRLKTHYAPLIYRPHRYAFSGLRLLFGDQAMACRASDFAAVGGFDESLPVMEDADLCLRMNRGLPPDRGRIRELPAPVQTSDRRVREWGVVRANVTYLAIAWGWAYGAPADWLGRFYPDVR